MKGQRSESGPRHRGLGGKYSRLVFTRMRRSRVRTPANLLLFGYTSLRNKSRLPRCTFQKSEEGRGGGEGPGKDVKQETRPVEDLLLH